MSEYRISDAASRDLHEVWLYIIFFREIDEGVEIVRVLSGRRDFEAIFRSWKPESS